MDAFLEELKNYLKIDDHDADIESIASAAIEKCENETGKSFSPESKLYGQAVKMIAADWYDHRGVTTTENLKDLPLSINVQSILNHISISTDYEEVEQ